MRFLDLFNSNPDIYSTDKNDPHSYIKNIYAPLFDELSRDKMVLEIGVYTGNSVKLWADFFHDGFVFGIDNMDKWLRVPLEDKNYKILIKEAYSLDSVNYFKEREINFDIIIEDGLHSHESQMFALEYYFELLNPGGMMIVEDIQTIDSAIYMLNTFSNCELIDLREKSGRYDDIVIIRRK